MFTAVSSLALFSGFFIFLMLNAKEQKTQTCVIESILVMDFLDFKEFLVFWGWIHSA